MNNLQARREGESDRAYLAYRAYRDLGENRSMAGAYRKYLETSSRKGISKSAKVATGVSPCFRGWATSFDWEARAKDWDKQKAERIQAALLDADRDSYIKRIEDSREQLERTALMGMHAAETSLTIAFAQLQEIAKESDKGILSKELIDRLLTLSRISKEAIDILGSAKTELYDALGLVQTIDELMDCKKQAGQAFQDLYSR